MRERELPRVDDRVVRIPRVDVFERVGVYRGRLHPLQRRGNSLPQVLEDALLRAAGSNRQFGLLELQGAAWLSAFALIHHQLRNACVWVGGDAGVTPLGG